MLLFDVTVCQPAERLISHTIRYCQKHTWVTCWNPANKGLTGSNYSLIMPHAERYFFWNLFWSLDKKMYKHNAVLVSCWVLWKKSAISLRVLIVSILYPSIFKRPDKTTHEDLSHIIDTEVRVIMKILTGIPCNCGLSIKLCSSFFEASTFSKSAASTM